MTPEDRKALYGLAEELGRTIVRLSVVGCEVGQRMVDTGRDAYATMARESFSKALVDYSTALIVATRPAPVEEEPIAATAIRELSTDVRLLPGDRVVIHGLEVPIVRWMIGSEKVGVGKKVVFLVKDEMSIDPGAFVKVLGRVVE